jgi:hypothetical protein
MTTPQISVPAETSDVRSWHISDNHRTLGVHGQPLARAFNHLEKKHTEIFAILNELWSDVIGGPLS